VAELNSSFIALRDRLPFNCATFERVRREPSTRVSLSLDECVRRDIDRIFSLLRQTKTQFSNDAAWLFGDDITIPDVWFAVTAIRLTAYIEIPSDIAIIFNQLLKLNGIDEWLALAREETEHIDNFDVNNDQHTPTPLHLMS